MTCEWSAATQVRRRLRRAPRQFLAALLTAACTAAAHAQPVSTRVETKVLERVERDRWIHQGQQPEFVRFDPVRSSIQVSATRSTSRVSPLSLTLQLRGLDSRLGLDSLNRIRFATVDMPRVNYSPAQDERMAAELRRRGLHPGEGAALGLPYARVWEVPFPVPAVPLARGVAWMDTLSFSAEHEGLAERFHAVRRNEVVGDTVIDGRSLPVVRTSAEVRYRSRDITTDAAFDVLFTIEHDASGTLVGTAAIDTAYGVRAAGSDTTRLSGTATLHTGDGRSFDSAVRYERERTWLLLDSLVWAARQDSAREEQRARSTGMLILPRNPLEERVRAGDAVAIDSLLTRWRATTDPDERFALQRILQFPGPQYEAIRERLTELRAAAGDSAGVVSEAMTFLGTRPALTPALLPYLDDIGRLWRLGIVPRFPYIEFANQLLAATPITQPDSTRWGCRPADCAAAIARLDDAAEPRLRDVALAGAFARDPARWYERVAARADSGSLIARNALRLARGVVGQTPVPDADADWRAWLAWLGNATRWDEGRANALRFHAARTGRDHVQELRSRLARAEHDSARVVYSAILRGMGALAEPTAAELARALFSDTERAAAQQQLMTLLRRNGAPAPDSLRTALLRPLLDSIAVRGGAPWDVAPWFNAQRVYTFGTGFHGVDDVPVFVLDRDLTPEVVAALPRAFAAISREAWDARPQREGGVLITVQPTVQWGDFVSIGWSWTALQRRAANEAPSGYAGGTSLTLLRTPQGWLVVASSGWIT